MKLYDFAPAPNPRRVRIFLAEKGIEVPTEQVDLRARAQHEPAFVARNPSATVPVLELDDGTCISESVAICRYFEALQPEPPLMGEGAREQALVEMWQRRMEIDGMMAAGEAFRNATPGFKDRALAGTAPVAQIAELAERGRERTQRFFRFLDEVLSDRDYIAGDHFTIADITALVAVDFAGWSKLTPGPELKNLAAWHARVSARPSAKA
jgi:glutathione S-transferase